MLRFAWIVLLPATLAFGEPNDAGELTREFLAEQQQTLDREFKEGPVLAARPMDQIIRLDFDDRQLRMALLPGDIKDSATIPLKGVNGICQVRRGGDSPNNWTATVFAFDRANARSVSLFLSPAAGRTRLDVVIQMPGKSMTTQIIVTKTSLFEDDDVGARMYFQASDEEGMTSSRNAVLVAETPAELFGENHDQMIECAAEGFRLLRAMHILAGMSDRQVSHLLDSEGTVSGDTEKALLSAIEAIEIDPDAGERQLKAVLDDAGAPAAAALLKMPRENWSAELTMRIDNLLAPYLPDDPGLPRELDADSSRLVDLLYWPEATVRAAVARRLSSALGKKLDIDAEADPYDAATKIEAIRASIDP